jgi:uncharacterized membrane protein YfcA
MIEDVQRIDPTTPEWLSSVVEHVAEERRSLNVTSGDDAATDILERRNCTGGQAGLKRNGLVDEILLALHESRRQQAKREIERYDHLVQYARAHPLRFDEREGPIGPDGAPGRTRESGLGRAPHPKWVTELPLSSRWIAPLAVSCACAGLVAAVFKAQIQMTVMAAVLVAALVSSIAGFAFSAICGAMLFKLINNPVEVVELMMVCSIAGQTWMTWALRHSITWRPLLLFLLGGLLGLPLGFYILLHSDAVVYSRGTGALLVLYAAYMLFRRPILWRRQRPLLDSLSGFVGGITGGAAAFPGAFVTIWCGMKGWDKERQRALYQPFILVMQVAAIAILTLLRPRGAIAPSLVLSSMVYLPAMLCGTMLGMTYFQRLNERQFFVAVNMLLIISGVSLVV